MLRNKALFITVVSTILVLFISFLAYSASADNSFELLKFQLKNKGVSDDFIRATEKSARRMLSLAAPVKEVESVLIDLWNEKIKGLSLKNAVASVAELVACGDNTLEAAKITSSAAHKAQSEGLGGFGVGMRVKKAVEDRKEYLKAAKK